MIPDSPPLQIGAPERPTAVIESIGPDAWRVGQTISFRGQATDAQGGRLPSSAMSWTILMHHCPAACHEHLLQQLDGVDGGSFLAPEHEYPMHLSVVLTVRVAGAAVATDTRLLHPQTTRVSLYSRPTGLELAFNGATAVTPFERVVIVGPRNSMSAPSQLLGRTAYRFVRWSGGGPQTRTLVAGARPSAQVAVFQAVAQDGTADPGPSN